MPETRRSMLKNGLILGLFALVTVGVVTLLREATSERIQAAKHHAQVRALGEILPPGSYDNDLLADSIQLVAPELGQRAPQTAYIALKHGVPYAIILPATATDGYGGPIRLLIGIRADGRLAGVRVIDHRETPGLGDRIELAKSPWIHSFEGRSLDNPAASGWAVKKDGGQFDQFTGATITPRAVVKAIHQALEYFTAHRNALLKPPGHGDEPQGNKP